MFSLMSPVTKVLGVATLVLLLLIVVLEKSRRNAFEEVGRGVVQVEQLSQQLGVARLDLEASAKALDAQKLEIAKNEALLIANEASRRTLEKRVNTLTAKLNTLGATRYDPPPQLCPSADHQPTLDDLLDAPLPPELVGWLRDVLSKTRPGGQGGQGVAPGTADASVPVAGSGGDDAARRDGAAGGDGR